MYNVGLQKKRYILPGKLHEEKNTVFACFKTYVKLPISISFFFQWYHIIYCSIPKDQDWSFRCDKFVFQKVYLFKQSPSYFHQSDQFYQNICTTFMLSHFREFFLDVCFCLLLFVALLLFCCCFCSFLFRFPFWPKF